MVLDYVDTDGHVTGTAPTLDKRYFQGPGVNQLLAQENVTQGATVANRVWWVLPDHLGSTRDLVDTLGKVVAHYQYDSFGVLLDGRENVTRYQYTGREHDSHTDLNYHRARWYDPLTGKWMSEDPIGLAAGDPNFTRMVGNNVLNATDPSGLWEIKRNGQPRAEAIFADGETVRQLAFKIRLNATEYKKWLKSDTAFLPALDEPLCGRQRFTVPNNIMVYHAKRSYHDTFTTVLSTFQWISNDLIKLERSAGYHVEFEPYGQSRRRFKEMFSDQDIYAFRFVGHGGIDGLLVQINSLWLGDNSRTVGPSEVNPPYHLAGLVLFACQSADPSVSPTGKVRYWSEHISALGYFHGYSGWAYVWSLLGPVVIDRSNGDGG